MTAVIAQYLPHGSGPASRVRLDQSRGAHVLIKYRSVLVSNVNARLGS